MPLICLTGKGSISRKKGYIAHLHINQATIPLALRKTHTIQRNGKKAAPFLLPKTVPMQKNRKYLVTKYIFTKFAAK